MTDTRHLKKKSHVIMAMQLLGVITYLFITAAETFSCTRRDLIKWWVSRCNRRFHPSRVTQSCSVNPHFVNVTLSIIGSNNKPTTNQLKLTIYCLGARQLIDENILGKSGEVVVAVVKSLAVIS
jgi:hypothetical protein